jgi:molybdenum cofactor synthesis domain-containing protein
MNKSVALLATGDELLNGDITDGNGQHISKSLFQHHIQNGLHLICSDSQKELENSMHFLLADHDALITTGGLGPTSDDRTRFALATVLNEKLVMNDEAWQHIVARFAERKLILSDNNKQQALFPQHAKIILNNNGSAAACEIQHHNKIIFMLPGPPNECLPIFDNYVLPKLIAEKFVCQVYRKRWMLTKISESYLASHIDPLMEQHACVIGYRVMKPDVELKVESHDEKVFIAVTDAIEHILNKL